MRIKSPNRDCRRHGGNRRAIWCESCDMALVSEGMKCPKCGNVQPSKKRREKKPELPITNPSKGE